MIGAGSGIATYLSFLDDLSSQTSSKMKVKKAHLIMIVRGGDQLSWISNYLKEFFLKETCGSKIVFHIYLTMKKKFSNFHSFLFWRSMMLLSVKNCDISLKRKKKKVSDPFTNSPVIIKFGRPDFEQIFQEIHKSQNCNQNVYACAPQTLCNHLDKVCKEVSSKSGFKFNFNPETYL